MTMKWIGLAGIFAVAFTAITEASATEYLVNGGFETGTFSGWTRGGNQTNTFLTLTGAQAGSWFVNEGPVSEGTLSQTFTDIAGETLHISGWVLGAGSSTSDIIFVFDGQTEINISPVPNQPWTQYSFDITATGQDTFGVGFFDSRNFDGIDSFSVASVAPIPEPSTWTMMILGFLGVGFLAYRRKSGSAAFRIA